MKGDHGNVIDVHPQHAEIMAALLAGISSRAIARSITQRPIVSYQTIQRYKNSMINGVKPLAIVPSDAEKTRIAREGKPRQPALGKTRPLEVAVDPVLGKIDPSLRDKVAKRSLFRRRLEKLHWRVNRGLDRAEEMDDLEVLPALLNQGHKNVELLGRATGELSDRAAGSTFALQIVCPSNPDPSHAAAPRISYAEAIDGDVYEAAEIGVLQRPE